MSVYETSSPAAYLWGRPASSRLPRTPAFPDKEGAYRFIRGILPCASPVAQVRFLEGLFGVMIAIMAGSFGIMYWQVGFAWI